VAHLGSYKDSTERDEHYPLLLEKNGFRLALLNYTYGTNGIPVPAPNVVNTIDTIQIARDINKAQSMKPDAIIAFMHWGVEYTLTPMKSQIDLADWLLKKGVTHVIGGHPHVVEPIEVREDKNGAKHVVAYSLGNLISNQSAPHTYGGMLVKMQLEKDSVTRMKGCNYSLYFVSRPVNSGNKQYRIYPVATPDSLLRPTEIRLRDTFVNSVRPFFEKRNKNIKEVMTFDISSFIE
jgi:poly-gamma-glutamate capsule biosynthesis protein CapA/YwtB (metallophosphatase superfamily)